MEAYYLVESDLGNLVLYMLRWKPQGRQLILREQQIVDSGSGVPDIGQSLSAQQCSSGVGLSLWCLNVERNIENLRHRVGHVFENVQGQADTIVWFPHGHRSMLFYILNCSSTRLTTITGIGHTTKVKGIYPYRLSVGHTADG